MFKRTTMLIAAMSLSSAVAAADLPTLPAKAPAFAVYPIGSGWFYGVSASGLGGTATASGGAQGGTVMGGRFGIDGGYTGRIGSTFWFAEASISGQMLNGASPALSVLSSFNFEERLAIGVPQSTWSSVLALVPGLSSVAFPSLPVLNGASFGPSNPYAFASLYQDDVSATLAGASGKSWLVSYGAGVGVLNRLSNGMMMDTSIEWKHGAGGLLVGKSNVQPFQDAYLATVRLKF